MAEDESAWVRYRGKVGLAKREASATFLNAISKSNTRSRLVVLIEGEPSRRFYNAGLPQAGAEMDPSDYSDQMSAAEFEAAWSAATGGVWPLWLPQPDPLDG